MATLIYGHAHFQLDSSEECSGGAALLSSYQMATHVPLFFMGTSCF